MTVETDHLHTSRRPEHASLPAPVCSLLAKVAGAPIATAHP